MAATGKGKKTSRPKAGPKPKKKTKKNKSKGLFSKIMILILLLAVIVTACFVVINNLKNNLKDDKEKTEIVVEEKKEKETKIDNGAIINTELIDNHKDNTEKNTIGADTETKTKTKTKAEEDKTKAKTKAKEEVMTEDKGKKEKKEENVVIDMEKSFKETHTLGGTWLSMMQGASLTIDNYGYRIDFFGVDASAPIIGKYSVDGNQITFINDDSECKGIKGIYKISFNKKNFSLIAKDDDCTKRRNILEADWEWIEI